MRQASLSLNRAEAKSGEGKVTPLELFSASVMDLEANVRGLIRAAT